MYTYTCVRIDSVEYLRVNVLSKVRIVIRASAQYRRIPIYRCKRLLTQERIDSRTKCKSFYPSSLLFFSFFRNIRRLNFRRIRRRRIIYARRVNNDFLTIRRKSPISSTKSNERVRPSWMIYESNFKSNGRGWAIVMALAIEGEHRRSSHLRGERTITKTQRRTSRFARLLTCVELIRSWSGGGGMGGGWVAGCRWEVARGDGDVSSRFPVRQTRVDISILLRANPCQSPCALVILQRPWFADLIVLSPSYNKFPRTGLYSRSLVLVSLKATSPVRSPLIQWFHSLAPIAPIGGT